VNNSLGIVVKDTNLKIVIDSKSNVADCLIEDAVNGIIEYYLTQKDTALVGTHEFALQILTPDSRITTRPGKYTIVEDLNK
jgi:hypothetical protein